MIMTELPIDIITNKKYKNLNKSNNFKEKERRFKRQEKQAKQIAELPNKFQKAIKAINTTQEKKPKKNSKPTNYSKKKMPISARSVQNILDEEYEGQSDAYELLLEIAEQVHWQQYQEFLALEKEEQIQNTLKEYERLIREAEKDYQFDYCDDLWDHHYIYDIWSSDEILPIVQEQIEPVYPEIEVLPLARKLWPDSSDDEI